jgi:hypothetical protein
MQSSECQNAVDQKYLTTLFILPTSNKTRMLRTNSFKCAQDFLNKLPLHCLSSGLLYCVVWCELTDISEVPAASNIRVTAAVAA